MACIRQFLENKNFKIKSQLKLNSTKTDIIGFSSKQNYESVKNLSIVIDDVVVPVKTDVRDLGVYFDTCLTMENHVNHVTRQCFMHLRNIAKVRQFLTCDALQSLIRAMVTSRLDYGNGISERLTTRLQRVQNYAARLIAGASRGDHITHRRQKGGVIRVTSHPPYGNPLV